ncbi:hypothetical protein PSYJYH_000053 [Bacillus phage PSYJ-YH]|nr:hypothetical protein PSYJYH_000053 [Bacillus phage PSYJ-YH]
MDFIMNFYSALMQSGKLVSDIDRQDVYSYLEIQVYMAKKKFYKQLAIADKTNF